MLSLLSAALRRHFAAHGLDPCGPVHEPRFARAVIVPLRQIGPAAGAQAYMPLRTHALEDHHRIRVGRHHHQIAGVFGILDHTHHGIGHFPGIPRVRLDVQQQAEPPLPRT